MCILAHPYRQTISIHAPAKGATNILDRKFEAVQFQSTLPRRERPFRKRLCVDPSDFNPRSREGSDELYCVLSDTKWTFQSTLPRRERP